MKNVKVKSYSKKYSDNEPFKTRRFEISTATEVEDYGVTPREVNIIEDDEVEDYGLNKLQLIDLKFSSPPKKIGRLLVRRVTRIHRLGQYNVK